MRRPVSEALKKMAEQGKETKKLNEQPDTFYAKQIDMAQLLPMDIYPTARSFKLVMSGGIYAYLGNLNDIDWDKGDDE